MAEPVSERSHERSIADEVKGWSQGKFFGVRGGRREENSNPSTEFSTPPSANTTVYNAEDLQQNGVLDVECQLGTGGMGHVYMARNKEDGTFVAVKVGKEGADRTGIESQLTEIVARRRLPADGHENLVRWFGYDDRALGCPIFLEVCTGGDLFDAAVDGYQRLSNVDILGIAQDIVSGLEYLHANGIVHCDLKPDNVLLQPNGKGGYTPKIGDLGGSMGTGDRRRGGGTYGYTAPEVIFTVRPAHGNQDAWSIGHMLLVLFTKRRHRTSNMFLHSRLLTYADYGMKAEMKDVGKEALFESYLTFKNMRDVSTLDTLLCEDLIHEEMANLPEFFRGVRQILCLEATQRPSMMEIHNWLGRMINILSPEDPLSYHPVPAENAHEERLLSPPVQASASTVARTKAACFRPPPGFSTTPAKNELYLPPPIAQGSSLVDGSGHDNLLVSPPAQPCASAGGRKKVNCIAPPPGFETAAFTTEKSLPPTTGQRPFQGESRHGNKYLAPSPAGVSASTGVRKKAVYVPPPPGFEAAVSTNEIYWTATALQTASVGKQGPACAEPMAASFGVDFPADTDQYGVAPGPSSTTACYEIDQQRAGSFETVYPQATFQEQQSTVHTPPCYGAPRLYSSTAGYPVVQEQRFSAHHAADFASAAAGYGISEEWRAHPPRGTSGWAGHGTELGGWSGQDDTAGCGCQNENVCNYKQRDNDGGRVGVPPQQLPAEEYGRRKEHFDRTRGSSKYAGGGKRVDAKKTRNRRRGGRRNRRPVPDQSAGGVTGWVNPGYPSVGGGCAVPQAIMIDAGTPFCYGGGGFHAPPHYYGYPVGVGAC